MQNSSVQEQDSAMAEVARAPQTDGLEEKWLFADQQYTVLRRPGEKNHQGLRAWNSADEYLLRQYAEANLPEDAKVLVVQDQFGALALHTHAWQPTILTDSLVAERVIRANLSANDKPVDDLRIVDPLVFAQDESPTKFDAVLLKIPRQREYLRMLLKIIRPHLKTDTLFLAAGMVKHVAPNARKDLADIIGAADVLRVWKKALVIRCTLEPTREVNSSIYPEIFKVPELGRTLCAWPNVFAAGKLDLGTRLLLEHMPVAADVTAIADLGCGSGIIAMAAATQFPEATVHAIDESALAIASCQAGMELNSGVSLTLHRADGLQEFAADSFDIILCNPPFHAEAALSLSETTRLLADVARTLRQAGEFRMVGRTSMPYVRLLSEYFGQVEIVAKRSGFSIVSARKPRK